MGLRGARAGARARPSDPALGRLLGLPLVPRDGARVLRGRGDRRLHERALRLRQGRPRGAPRRRRPLHGGGAGDQRPGRLADDGLLRSRGRALLRRHLLPARREPRHAELSHGDGSGARRVRESARGAARAGARDAPAAGRDRRRRAGRRAARRRAARGGGRDPARERRPAARRLRRRAQVPARLDARAAAGARRARAGRAHARRDDGGRHLRPARRRLRPLLGRRELARPPLREDALRQRAAGARLPARLAGLRPRALSPDRRGDARLGAARDARARGRLLLGARRRLRGRGGPLLRLDAR